MWFNDPSFNEVVQEASQTHPDDIIQTLNNFTTRVRIRNKECFGNIFHRKNKVLARLKGTQTTIYSNSSHFLLKLEKELTAEFHLILKLEEDFWALKSMTEWNMLGDHNINFFHISTIRRRHHNKIWCLKDDTGN